MSLPNLPSKPISAIDALSSASGLSRDKIKAIAEKVKANHIKLDGCSGPHRFTIPVGHREFADDFVCEKCGGWVSSIHKSWYEKGLEHGRMKAGIEMG